MSFFLAFTAAALPTLLYTLIIWWLDRYEKEPPPLLAAAFLWGSLPAVAIALVTGHLLAMPPGAGPLGPGLNASGIAPLIEEPVKAFALVGLFLFARSEFDGPLDGIVYGTLIGFGFSMSENLLFFLAYPENLGGLFWVRGVLFGFNHALFTGLVGLALGAARFASPRTAALAVVFALAGAIALHALHNYAVDHRMPGLAISWLVQSSGVLAVLAVAALSWRNEAGWISRELGEEIALGVIDARDYRVIASAPLRVRAQLHALLGGGFARFRRVRLLHHLMTELAFCKHQLALGDRYRSCDARDELRHRISAMRAELAGDDESEPLVA